MRSSKWFYLLVGIALIHFISSLAGTVFLDSILGAGGVYPIFYAIFSIFGLILTPVFFIALYFDAGIVLESSSLWNPDRRLWIGGGILFSLVSYILLTNVLVEYIAFVYVIRRFRNPPVKKSGDRLQATET